MANKNFAGALVGWKRNPSDNGIVLSLQMATSGDDFRNRAFDEVSLALNDRQLRSLARDLQRAANQRGIQLWGERRRLGFLSWFSLKRDHDDD